MATITHPGNGKIEIPAVHLKRLLVVHDFSPTADAVLAYALLLARLFKSEITLVHAIAAIELPEDELAGMRSAHAHAGGQLQIAASRIQKHGIRCASICRTGNPSDVLVQVASEVCPDLLIMGASGYGTTNTSVRRSSTAEFIIRSMPCPTLTINANTAMQQGRRVPRVQSILYASSFRGQPGKAFLLAETVARVSRAAVEVIHVVDRTRHNATSLPKSEHGDQTVVDLFNRVGVAASSRLVEKPAAKSIVERAEQSRAGIIIFGVEHKPIDPSSISMIAEVIAWAPCPVLTAPGTA